MMCRKSLRRPGLDGRPAVSHASRLWPPFHPRVVVSALGEEAVLQGAIATALQAARDRLFSRSQTA